MLIEHTNVSNYEEMSKAIIQQSHAYHVDPILVTKVLIVESHGNTDAYNAKTHDHGLMQLNDRTLLQHNISLQCAYNWWCNLEQGIKLLSKAKRPCAYNLGNRGSQDKSKTKQCLRYEKKLSNIKLIKEIK
jgi:hypothetical protein